MVDTALMLPQIQLLGDEHKKSKLQSHKYVVPVKSNQELMLTDINVNIN